MSKFKNLSLVLAVFFAWTTLVFSQSIYESTWKGEIKNVAEFVKKDPKIVNELSEWGYSALMMAAVWNNINPTEMIEFLLSKGADINLRSKEGKTVLHLAAEDANEDIVKLLIENNADPYIKDKMDRAPFFYAILGKRKEISDLLFKQDIKFNIKGEDGIMLLHNATSAGNKNFIDILRKRGIDLRLKRKDGGTILHSAAEGGLSDLIKTGLDSGLKINQKNIYFLSPLHLAVESGHIETIKMLIKNGADVHQKDNLSKTPYNIAVQFKHQEIIDFLVKSGANKTNLKYNVSGVYFGQKPPGKFPEIFAPGIISTQKGFEFAGVFSPDGKEYYFTQRGLGFGQRIRFMKMESGKWKEPDFPSFAYDSFEFEPGISPDGKTLYYGSRRPLPGKSEQNPSADIWVVKRKAEEWSEPEFVGTDMMYVTITNSGTIYYTGQSENSKMRGIVKKEMKNGELGKAIDLGKNINFMTGTAHPFIAPDESYLIFDAQPNGVEAGPELFISFKNSNGTWTKAIAFGEEFNKKRDMCAFVSFDNKYLFFAREGDIYWVKANIIQDLKRKVF